jgi:hypothetical protein
MAPGFFTTSVNLKCENADTLGECQTEDKWKLYPPNSNIIIKDKNEDAVNKSPAAASSIAGGKKSRKKLKKRRRPTKKRRSTKRRRSKRRR